MYQIQFRWKVYSALPDQLHIKGLLLRELAGRGGEWEGGKMRGDGRGGNERTGWKRRGKGKRKRELARRVGSHPMLEILKKYSTYTHSCRDQPQT